MRVCPKCSLETDAAVCPNDAATTVAVRAAAETYASGTIINDRYRVEEVIGIGGFGAVYKCTQLNMDQEVAVKVLKSEHLTSIEHVKRFTREAQAASRLKHPNTISIFDFGTHEDGALYLAMEFLHGETFANRMDEYDTMDVKVLAHIMVQICHSLTEAHRAGLIHRDLKPENIMLLPVAGDPNFVKVLDFGIAKFESETATEGDRLTEAGMIMGTPTYMSPEQARGEVLDARSDIYALGVLMYEAVSGRVPFEGDQPMTVLVKHIKDPPEPPRQVAPQACIPRAFEKVILRCLEKQPDHRPQSAEELAEALKKAIQTPDDALLRAAELEAAGEEPPAEAPTEVMSALMVTEALAAERLAPSGRTRMSPATPYLQAAGPAGNRTSLWIGLAAFAFVGLVAVVVVLMSVNDAGGDDKLRPGSRAGPPAQGSPTTVKMAPPPGAAAKAATSPDLPAKTALGGEAAVEATGSAVGSVAIEKAPADSPTATEATAPAAAPQPDEPSPEGTLQDATTDADEHEGTPPTKDATRKVRRHRDKRTHDAGATRPADRPPKGSGDAKTAEPRGTEPSRDDFRLPN